jgi:hypothetical protein
MKLITLSIIVLLASLGLKAQKVSIGSFIGMSIYGNSFGDNNYRGNVISQNNHSLNAFITFNFVRKNEKDLEVDFGLISRLKDGYQTDLIPISYTQDFLSLRIFSHRKINLIDNVLSFNAGSGLYFNTLIGETINTPTLTQDGRAFAKINTLGIMSDWKFNIKSGFNRETFTIGSMFGVDCFSSDKNSQLFLFEPYIGYKFSF